MRSINILRQAYQDRNLTLYLGAGLSIGSGLPSWDALVLAMYFKVMDRKRLGGKRTTTTLFWNTPWTKHTTDQFGLMSVRTFHKNSIINLKSS